MVGCQQFEIRNRTGQRAKAMHGHYGRTRDAMHSLAFWFKRERIDKIVYDNKVFISPLLVKSNTVHKRRWHATHNKCCYIYRYISQEGTANQCLREIVNTGSL